MINTLKEEMIRQMNWRYWSNEPIYKQKVVRIVSENNKKEEEKMKLSDFIKKYGDCEVTEEMEKCIEKPKKKGKWMPARDTRYWYVNGLGYVTYDDWYGSHMDHYRRDFLRIFKTGAEAERYLEIMKACKEASFEPDWDDFDQVKWSFYYQSYAEEVYINRVNVCNEGQPFFFESKEIAQNLIYRFGEKDIAKYVLGVEVEE